MKTEKRLIDANALMDVIRQHEYPLATRIGSIDNGMFTLGIQQVVDEAPTVEAVVLPCELGDDVYLIPKYGGKPYCGVVKDEVQMIGITSRGFHIKSRRHQDHNKTYFLGKSAFLTREEAEVALANMDE